MVICKYFLTNSCSFGTQCKNEHINVATVLKTDADAAIKGKQWVLSCYGPFKDKPSIPNFEDQSFEEIRSMCYEAKNNGTLQALLPQLGQQVADATYKITMLCDANNVNNNLLNMLVNLYNSGEPSGNAQSTGNNNPFAIGSAVGGGQTSSIFGTSATQQQNPFGGGSLFGNKAGQTNSIFGGGNNTANSASTGSFFGQQSTFGNSGTSVFGASSSNNTSSVFGASPFGQQQQQQPSNSPFSLSQIAQQPNDPSKSSIFGGSQFQQTQNSVFGAAPAFGSQAIQPTKPSGLFGTPNTTSIFGQSQPAAGTGLFGQQANQPTSAGGNVSTGLFGQQQSSTGGSIFSSFGASAQPQQNPFGAPTENKSIFGQSTNPNPSIFGANQQQPNQSSNIFANALAQQQQQQQSNTTNVFGVQIQPEQQQQQQPQQSVFGQPNSNANNSSNIFQNQTNSAPLGGSVFGGNAFGQPAAEQMSQSAYSKLEDLAADDLQCFQANEFVLGKIPTVPPPKELCI